MRRCVAPFKLYMRLKSDFRFKKASGLALLPQSDSFVVDSPTGLIKLGLRGKEETEDNSKVSDKNPRFPGAGTRILTAANYI